MKYGKRDQAEQRTKKRRWWPDEHYTSSPEVASESRKREEHTVQTAVMGANQVHETALCQDMDNSDSPIGFNSSYVSDTTAKMHWMVYHY